jgi:hypothetical protein
MICKKKGDSEKSPFVRAEGLEPPCLTAPDPKSGASTNFATPAGCEKSGMLLREKGRKYMSDNQYTGPSYHEIFDVLLPNIQE